MNAKLVSVMATLLDLPIGAKLCLRQHYDNTSANQTRLVLKIASYCSFNSRETFGEKVTVMPACEPSFKHLEF